MLIYWRHLNTAENGNRRESFHPGQRLFAYEYAMFISQNNRSLRLITMITRRCKKEANGYLDSAPDNTIICLKSEAAANDRRQRVTLGLIFNLRRGMLLPRARAMTRE